MLFKMKLIYYVILYDKVIMWILLWMLVVDWFIFEKLLKIGVWLGF